MAISKVAAVDTPKTANGTTLTANRPAGSVGDLLAFFYVGTDASKYLTKTDWTDLSASAGGGERTGVIYRVADTADAGTDEFTWSSGSAQGGGIMVRFSAPGALSFNSNNVHGDMGSSVNPFYLAANTLTGAAAGSLILCLWGNGFATRTISALDGDQTLIDSATGGASGFCAHLADETGVTASSEYSTTMNDTRDYAYGLFELVEAGGGGATPSITSVNGDAVAILYEGQKRVLVAGSDFGSGTKGVYLNAAAENSGREFVTTIPASPAPMRFDLPGDTTIGGIGQAYLGIQNNDSGNTGWVEIDLRENPSPNPVLKSSPASVEISQGVPVSIDLGALFYDHEAQLDQIDYDATGLPTGLSMDDDGVVSGTIDAGITPGTPFSVTVTVTDLDGNTADDSFTWTIDTAAVNPPVPSRTRVAVFSSAF